MGLNTKTPIASIMLELTKEMQLAEEEIAEELARLGEEGVNEARLNGSYTDRTGNLRSSIGYVMAKGGNVITSSNFAKIIGNDNPDNIPVNGDEIGKKLATDAAKRLSKDGFALVMVAGMEYASYVADRGYNVLDSAEMHVRERLDTRFKQLGFGVGKTIRKSGDNDNND